MMRNLTLRVFITEVTEVTERKKRFLTGYIFNDLIECSVTSVSSVVNFFYGVE